MSLEKVINFFLASNFISDAGIIFPGTQAELEGQRPANVTFVATYTDNVNGSWGAGVLVGTAFGGASITNNRLDLAQNDLRYVDYDADLNADSQQVGAIKFKVTPNYSGTPGVQQTFFLVLKESGVLDNLIQIAHLANGRLFVSIHNSSGVTIMGANFGTWNTVNGTTYEIELNYDLTVGATRLFIDGVQFGVTQTATGVRDELISLLRVGAGVSANFNNNFFLEDLIIFDIVQHTANYTPGYTLPEEIPYPTNNPTSKVNQGQLADAWSAFTASVIEPTGSSIRFVIETNDGFFWYNGSTWVVSDLSPAQSNTKEDMNTFAPLLVISQTVGTLLNPVAIFISDGIAKPSISTMSFDYDFFIIPISSTKCLLYGGVFDNGVAVVGAKLAFTSKGLYPFDGNLENINAEAITDEIGKFEISLPRTALPDPDINVSVIISFTDSKGTKQNKSITIVIPDLESAAMTDHIVIST